MVPTHSAEVFFSVFQKPESRDFFTEDICGSKFYFGLSYSAVGCEFKVNESTTYIK